VWQGACRPRKRSGLQRHPPLLAFGGRLEARRVLRRAVERHLVALAAHFALCPPSGCALHFARATVCAYTPCDAAALPSAGGRAGTGHGAMSADGRPRLVTFRRRSRGRVQAGSVLSACMKAAACCLFLPLVCACCCGGCEGPAALCSWAQGRSRQRARQLHSRQASRKDQGNTSQHPRCTFYTGVLAQLAAGGCGVSSCGGGGIL
jgi:hypothetical protein